MVTTATPTITPAGRRSRWVTLGRVLLVLVVLIAVLIGAAVLWFRHAAYAALPQVDGTIHVAGLSAPVKVIRDAQGVPHISAASLHDLFLAQGYVTAQDRLWQMDMTRRYAAGELSEVLGERALKSDTTQRILGLRQVADEAAKRVTDRDRAFGEAYAAGINAYIEQHRDSLPLEFRVLRYAPRPWTISDSFLIGASMAEMLTEGAISHELARERITQKIGPELAADLFPNSSWRDRPPAGQAEIADFSQPDPEQKQVESDELRRKGRGGEEDEEGSRVPHRRHHRASAQRVDLDRDSAVLGELPWLNACSDAESSDCDSLQPLAPGSNNWVVSGSHTASGKPLLSNDMHLPHRVPGIWYEAQLKCSPQAQTPAADRDLCAKFDVAGVTLPGLPMVIVGHNQRIAWGFTNIGPTVQDLYIETFNSNGEYEAPDGWKKPETRHETIKVKHTAGMKEVPVNVVITRHGPMVTSLYPRETRPLAMKWTLYSPDGMTFPFFDVDTAQNWDEFTHAFSQFGSPAQNVVYADVDGHIGYHATGKIPLRVSGDGSAPLPGTDNAHEWTGFIPFDQLPSVYDPPSGILATANGRIAPDNYPNVISNEWGPPYRTERILRVLQTKQKLTPADMLALQTDVQSEFDRFCAQRFVYAVDRSTKASKRAKEAAEYLRKWDGQVTTGSVAASIVSATRRQFVRILLEPRLGNDWTQYRWFGSSVWIENTLLRQPDRWLPSGYSNYDDLLADALEKAVNADAVPKNLKDWIWGSGSQVSVAHPIFGSMPFLKQYAGSESWEQSGDGFTVKQVGSDFGPSERMTVDFSNLDNSTLNLVSGQSGALFSPHFMDQWNAWLKGTTFALPYTDSAVSAAKSHELTLQ
jgi:penicillin amidase